jgi:hypothetical protein
MRRRFAVVPIAKTSVLGVCAVLFVPSLGAFHWQRPSPAAESVAAGRIATAVTRAAVASQAEGRILSDVNPKENFKDLDGDAVLSKIATMPIREWNYKAQEASVRHLGPTAQDFHAAFGLGDDRSTINGIDADGVALRAIQALEARSRAQHANILEDTRALADANDSLVLENTERRAEIAALRGQIVRMRLELKRLRDRRPAADARSR